MVKFSMGRSVCDAARVSAEHGVDQLVERRLDPHVLLQLGLGRLVAEVVLRRFSWWVGLYAASCP